LVYLYKDVDFEDIDTIDSSQLTEDFPLRFYANPACSIMKRVDFFQLMYTGSEKLNEDIFEKVISPSIIVELPNEEFYAAINPETGFESIEGLLSGSIITELFFQWSLTKKSYT
jgi:hypothetical protein